MTDDEPHRLDDADPATVPEDATRDENGDPDALPGPDSDADSVTHHINESADKITLNTKIKRGTGTRDQDEIKVKVKGDDAEQTAQMLHETVVAIGDRGTVNALRGTQPHSTDE